MNKLSLSRVYEELAKKDFAGAFDLRYSVKVHKETVEAAVHTLEEFLGECDPEQVEHSFGDLQATVAKLKQML